MSQSIEFKIKLDDAKEAERWKKFIKQNSAVTFETAKQRISARSS